jgi:hypothetical protein
MLTHLALGGLPTLRFFCNSRQQLKETTLNITVNVQTQPLLFAVNKENGNSIRVVRISGTDVWLFIHDDNADHRTYTTVCPTFLSAKDLYFGMKTI